MHWVVLYFLRKKCFPQNTIFSCQEFTQNLLRSVKNTLHGKGKQQAVTISFGIFLLTNSSKIYVQNRSANLSFKINVSVLHFSETVFFSYHIFGISKQVVLQSVLLAWQASKIVTYFRKCSISQAIIVLF